MSKFQPMLAEKVELSSVKYPVFCSPKLDGIRCIIRGGVAVSRTLKEIPNRFVASLLQTCPDNLDGELIIPRQTFNQIQSAIMSEQGEPTFEYHVFDVISERPYNTRMDELSAMVLPAFCRKVLPHVFENEDDLLEYERECVEDYEYEGIMLRSPTGPYKFGRSTMKQGYLLKLKRFEDDEAVVVDFEEMMHNENPSKVDARGYAKRSSKKDGMVPAGILGAFIVRMANGKTFNVSTGLTMEQRRDYWGTRDALLGTLVKYKFQGLGAKGLPRFPVFLGFRHPDDL